MRAAGKEEVLGREMRTVGREERKGLEVLGSEEERTDGQEGR
jgi:hypothetical protein